MKQKWDVLHDCDGENGEPTCWVMEINHSKYGKYVWITETGVNFDVEVDRGCIVTLISCKSLSSAKRWVTINLLQ